MRTGTCSVILLGVIGIMMDVAAAPENNSNQAPLTAYLCVTDQSIGFAFNEENREWFSTKFENDKYLVSKSTKKGYAWEVKKLGDKAPIAMCKDDFGGTAGVLRCDGGIQLNMSRKNSRFIVIQSLGYWSDDNDIPMFSEGANTPFMKIGKCSPL